MTKFSLLSRYTNLLHEIRGEQPTPEQLRDWCERLAEIGQDLALKLERIERAESVDHK